MKKYLFIICLFFNVLCYSQDLLVNENHRTIINFYEDSCILKKNENEKLIEFSKYVNEETIVFIIGYSNSENIDLANERVKSIRDILWEELNVNCDRIICEVESIKTKNKNYKNKSIVILFIEKIDVD